MSDLISTLTRRSSSERSGGEDQAAAWQEKISDGKRLVASLVLFRCAQCKLDEQALLPSCQRDTPRMFASQATGVLGTVVIFVSGSDPIKEHFPYLGVSHNCWIRQFQVGFARDFVTLAYCISELGANAAFLQLARRPSKAHQRINPSWICLTCCFAGGVMVMV